MLQDTTDTFLQQELSDLDTSMDAESTTTSTTTEAPSVRSTGKAIRNRRPIAAIETPTFDKQRIMTNFEAAVSGLQAISDQIEKKDEYDSFAEYVATSLRVIPTQFAVRLMTKIKLEVAQIGLDAANYEMRRQRMLPQNSILVLSSNGQYIEYYAFGGDDAAYDPRTHNSIKVFDSDANVVRDPIIIKEI